MHTSCRSVSLGELHRRWGEKVIIMEKSLTALGRNGIVVTKACREWQIFKFSAYIIITSICPPFSLSRQAPSIDNISSGLLKPIHIVRSLCRGICAYIHFLQPSIYVHWVRLTAHIPSSVGGSEHRWYNATNTLIYRPSCQQILVTQGQSDTLWITVKQALKLGYEGSEAQSAASTQQCGAQWGQNELHLPVCTVCANNSLA